MTKILVWASPIAPFQRVTLIKNNTTSEVGVTMADLGDTIFETAMEHGIEEVEFYGNREFCLGVMHDLCKHDKYTNTITIKHIGG